MQTLINTIRNSNSKHKVFSKKTLSTKYTIILSFKNKIIKHKCMYL